MTTPSVAATSASLANVETSCSPCAGAAEVAGVGVEIDVSASIGARAEVIVLRSLTWIPQQLRDVEHGQLGRGVQKRGTAPTDHRQASRKGGKVRIRRFEAWSSADREVERDDATWHHRHRLQMPHGDTTVDMHLITGAPRPRAEIDIILVEADRKSTRLNSSH